MVVHKYASRPCSSLFLSVICCCLYWVPAAFGGVSAFDDREVGQPADADTSGQASADSGGESPRDLLLRRDVEVRSFYATAASCDTADVQSTVSIVKELLRTNEILSTIVEQLELTIVIASSIEHKVSDQYTQKIAGLCLAPDDHEGIDIIISANSINMELLGRHKVHRVAWVLAHEVSDAMVRLHGLPDQWVGHGCAKETPPQYIHWSRRPTVSRQAAVEYGWVTDYSMTSPSNDISETFAAILFAPSAVSSLADESEALVCKIKAIDDWVIQITGKESLTNWTVQQLQRDKHTDNPLPESNYWHIPLARWVRERPRSFWDPDAE